MKILFVTYHIYPSKGGAQNYILDLAKGMSKRGHNISIYTTNSITNEKNAGLSEQEFIDDVLIKRFPIKQKLYSFWNSPGMFKQIKQDCQSREYDLVIAFGYNLLSTYITCKYCKKYQIPFILNGIDIRIPTTSSIYKKMLKKAYDKVFSNFLIKNSKKLISFTTDDFEEYIKLGAKKSQLETIPPPMDLSLYKVDMTKEFLNKYDIKKNDKVILYAGRITPHKRLQDIIEMLPMDNVKFFIIGEVYDEKYYERLFNIEREDVFFVNAFPTRHKTLLQFYKRADIFVLPSQYEGFGMVLTEANAMGTPVVAYDTQGVREVVKNGITGYLVKSKKEFREAIIKLLKNNTMGENGKEYVKRFETDVIINKLIEICEEVK